MALISACYLGLDLSRQITVVADGLAQEITHQISGDL